MNGGGGDDDPLPIDAPAPTEDGASPADAPPEMGMVTVEYLGDSYDAVVAGHTVVFADNDGTQLGTEVTDADGKASHVIPRDATVTLVRVGTYDVYAVTRIGVQPGETLRFGTTWQPLPTIATMTVSWPSAGTGYRYDVKTPCGGSASNYINATSTTITIDERCAGKTFDVYVARISTFNYDVHGYLMATAQTANDGGSITVTGTWSDNTQPLEGTYAVPTGTRISGLLSATYDTRDYDGDDVSMSGYTTSPTASLSYRLLPAPGSQLLHEVELERMGQVQKQIVGRRFPYATQVGFDITSSLTTWIASASFDKASRTLTWSTETTQAADVVRANFAYNRSATQDVRWLVIAPGDVTSVVLPALPGELAVHGVTAQDTVTGALALVDVDRSFATIASDLGTWLARHNLISLQRPIDWADAPTDLDHFTMSLLGF
jgi:hypothetical protein